MKGEHHPRGFRFFAMALLALCFAASSTSAQEAAAGALRGRVLSELGEPLAAAHVQLSGGGPTQAAITDTTGRYRIVGIAPGRYTVRVEAIGYRAAEQVRVLGVGESASMDFTLAPAPVALSGLVVSATRSSVPVAAVPGAVSVITREEVQEQALTSGGMGEILGKAVPGLAVGTQSMSNYGQSLRGRNVVVLIDGVSQSTLRNVSRDFATIDPTMIERVEVLRGATSLYGDGATGGVINILTRRPGAGPIQATTEVGMDASLSQFARGVGGRLAQSVLGKQGRVDYVASGSFSRVAGFYDAEGDLIPSDPHGQGGLADTRNMDLLGKLGYGTGPQRIQLSGNHYFSDQDTRFTADPAVNEFPAGTHKARALAGLREDLPQGTRNTVLSADYSHDSLLGSRIHAQLYFRDYMSRFRGFDRRRFRSVADTLEGGSIQQRREWVSGQVGQSFIDSEKWGGRLESESYPLGENGPSLLMGADYMYENTAQLMSIMDSQTYDQSGGLEFRKTGERTWVPPLRPHNLGLFAQLGWNVTDRLLLRGGVRHERVRMTIDDFVTLDDNQVYGGHLAYDPTLFNVGAVLDVTDGLNVYANFSQGFSLADIGRILRSAADGFDLGKNTLEAPVVDHYEAGVRTVWRAVETSLTGFYSTSKLGTRLVLTDNNMLEVVRSPERIYGLEATLDLRPSEQLGVGGTLSWTEGEAYREDVQEYRAFDGYRIQPMKVTAYVEHHTSPRLFNRLQLLYSGSRDRAFRERTDPTKPAGYGEQPVESFWVVDLSSRAKVGPGTLKLGIQNLLNRQYYDIVSQLDLIDGNQYYTAARGAMLSASYSVSY